MVFETGYIVNGLSVLNVTGFSDLCICGQSVLYCLNDITNIFNTKVQVEKFKIVRFRNSNLWSFVFISTVNISEDLL